MPIKLNKEVKIMIRRYSENQPSLFSGGGEDQSPCQLSAPTSYRPVMNATLYADIGSPANILRYIQQLKRLL